jgi:hypothetical protein
MAVAIVPSIPASPRLHGDALARNVGVCLANESGCPEHEPVVRPRHAPHGFHEHPPCHGLPEYRELFAGKIARTLIRGRSRCRLDCKHAATGMNPAAEPRPSTRSSVRNPVVDDRPIDGRCTMARVVGVCGDSAHDVHNHVRTAQHGRYLATEGGMSEHDRTLDSAAVLGVIEQSPIGDDEVRTIVRSARYLGEQRHPEGPREHLGFGPGAVSGDDDRVGGSPDLAWRKRQGFGDLIVRDLREALYRSGQRLPE